MLVISLPPAWPRGPGGGPGADGVDMLINPSILAEAPRVPQSRIILTDILSKGMPRVQQLCSLGRLPNIRPNDRSAAVV